jgi:hypothetical protein
MQSFYSATALEQCCINDLNVTAATAGGRVDCRVDRSMPTPRHNLGVLGPPQPGLSSMPRRPRVAKNRCVHSLRKTMQPVTSSCWLFPLQVRRYQREFCLIATRDSPETAYSGFPSVHPSRRDVIGIFQSAIITFHLVLTSLRMLPAAFFVEGLEDRRLDGSNIHMNQVNQSPGHDLARTP